MVLEQPVTSLANVAVNVERFASRLQDRLEQDDLQPMTVHC